MLVMPRVSITTIRRAGPCGASTPGRYPGHLGRFFWHGVRTLIVLGWLIGSCGWASGTAGRLATLQEKYQKLHTLFLAELESMATTCDQENLNDLSHQIRSLQAPPETLGGVDKLPAHVQPSLPSDLAPAESAVRIRLQKVRSDYANDLYGLSRKALKEQYTSLAFRLVSEVLIHNPDHPQARGLLGYQRIKDEWTTLFALKMKREKNVWHDDFGWIPSAHVSRYESGERYYNGKWMTAQREETLRSNFKNAWEVETEHFLVRTNHSLEKGAQLAAAVDVFHAYFMREFAAFFKSPQQLDKLFTSGSASRDGNQYEIHYFRNRQEFVNQLAKHGPLISQINGIYLPQDRIAYFFHNSDIPEEESLETLYHEVTHQLLSESTTQTVSVGHSQDFWVIEGIACYFESFQVEEDGSIRVGDINHPRIRAAREQVVTTQDQEPLARFTIQGKVKFQAGETPVLQKRYAQATGLTHFFLNYQGGLYRDEFIEYLTRTYSPDQRVRGAKTLEQVIGVPYATLDSQYAAYFREMTQPATLQTSQ